MITYNNKSILKSFIGNNRIVKKYLNNEVVYGTPDFAQYYNIQGYDNYEVVGSPTIADGVASGFSATSYVTTTSSIGNTEDDLEIVIAVNNATVDTGIGTVIGGPFTFGVSFNYSQKLTAYVRNIYDNWILNGAMGTSTFANNTDYLFKFLQQKVNGSFNISILSSADNGNTWTTEVTTTSTYPVKTSSAFVFGATANSSLKTQYQRGSIDLNNTYIKVNAKYLFNGNPNYKELLDFNPNVYLKNTNTSYVDTNYIPSKYTRIKFNFKIDNVREISSNTRNWIMGASANYRTMNNFYAGFWQNSYTYASFWPNSTNLGSAQRISYVWELNKKYFVDFKGSSAIPNDAYTDLYDENGNRKFHILNSNTDDIDMLGKTLLLFTRKDNVNSPNTYFLGSLYTTQIYERDVLKMNLVPVPKGLQIGSYKVPSNGMFDIVEQKFYENKGSGEFIWGVDL